MSNILEKIKQIKDLEIQGLEELLCEEQMKMLNKSNLLILKPDHHFVMVDEDISSIWVLLSGKVKGLEELHTGDVFAFSTFHAPEIFGEMEALSDIPKFKATLTTETQCTFLLIPTEYYKEFLKNNSNFLYQRTKVIIKRYFEDQKRLRTFLMIKSIDRLKIYLSSQYELNAVNGKSILRIPRPQIAVEIGYAIKTVNRTVAELKNQNLLTIEGQKIIITKEQYRKMRKAIEHLIS